MVLAGVDLTDDPADPWAIVSMEYKQVLNDKPNSGQFVDQLHMGQTLLVRANFVSALDDIDPFVSENPMGFLRGFEIQV